MSVFTADIRALFVKAKATRADLLNLNPPVKRIDDYAGTRLTPTVDQFRVSMDSMIQKQKETATDLSGAITNYFMFHEEANNPEFTPDIIAEFANMLKMFHLKAENADISESSKALFSRVEVFHKQLVDTLKIKDKAIDDELTAATTQVSNFDAQISGITAQITELRKKLNQGNISKAVDATKNALKTKKDTDPTETGTPEDDAAIKEEIKKLEAQRTVVEGKRQTARDRQIRAGAVSDARDKADTPATVAALSKVEMDLANYETQSAKLTAAWNAMQKEVEDYHALFVANRDQNTPETKSALSSHITKVTSTKPTLEAFAKSLKDAAFNV